MKILGIGLDLGSTTAKFAVVDSEGKILESDYRRHGAASKGNCAYTPEELPVKYPDTAFELMLTGSAALDLAVSAGAGFIQEVIASSRAIKRVAPDTNVAIELGGEDAKILYLSDGMELRMNEVCAGGTGAFIDQMASLLNTDASGSINWQQTQRRSTLSRHAAAFSQKQTSCLF
ncbi:MAG: BadF/BadG/BcrA/BcrD ATPase family protein [Dakarella massiliensis]